MFVSQKSTRGQEPHKVHYMVERHAMQFASHDRIENLRTSSDMFLYMCDQQTGAVGRQSEGFGKLH